MKMRVLVVLSLGVLTLCAYMAAPAVAKVCSGAGTGELCAGTHGRVYSGEMDATLKTGMTATLTATNAEGKTVSTVTCATSTVKGTVSGSTATGSISSVTFGNCSSSMCPNGITASTTASTANPWSAHATTETAPNGSITVENLDGEFVCGSILGSITCHYTSSSGTGVVTGGAPATVSTPFGLAKISGPEAVCGSKADWSGTYLVTTPNSAYLT